MRSDNPNELAEEILRLYELEGTRPMPQSGFHCIVRAAGSSGKNLERLRADVSNYWVDIIEGVSSRAQLLSQDSTSKLQDLYQGLQKTFFDWYPEYDAFESLIMQVDDVEFHREWLSHEELREKLLCLIELLLAERGASVTHKADGV